MITLLSLLFGFLAPSMKDFVKFFQDKQDNAHELSMAGMQIAASERLGKMKLEEVRIRADSEDLGVRYATLYKGNANAAFLNEIIRSIIALGMMGVYWIVCYLYFKELDAMNNAPFFATHMWTEEDYALLGAIVGYYFGSKRSGRGA